MCFHFRRTFNGEASSTTHRSNNRACVRRQRQEVAQRRHGDSDGPDPAPALPAAQPAPENGTMADADETSMPQKASAFSVAQAQLDQVAAYMGLTDDDRLYLRTCQRDSLSTSL